MEMMKQFKCKRKHSSKNDIRKHRVETLEKVEKRDDIVYTEQKGNKNKHRRYFKDDDKLTISRTESFPKQESHYTRSKYSNEYISELKLQYVYLAFKELHPNTQVAYRYYTDNVKKSSFKLRFQNHKKICMRCAICCIVKYIMNLLIKKHTRKH